MTAPRPTRIVLTLAVPMNWGDARVVGEAIDQALGGNAKVDLDRDGCRWTFTSGAEGRCPNIEELWHGAPGFGCNACGERGPT